MLQYLKTRSWYVLWDCLTRALPKASHLGATVLCAQWSSCATLLTWKNRMESGCLDPIHIALREIAVCCNWDLLLSLKEHSAPWAITDLPCITVSAPPVFGKHLSDFSCPPGFVSILEQVSIVQTHESSAGQTKSIVPVFFGLALLYPPVAIAHSTYARHGGNQVIRD